MSTATEERLSNTGSNFDELGHLNCSFCNADTGPQKAYCGKQLQGIPSNGDLCVVCSEIACHPCPQCGA